MLLLVNDVTNLKQNNTISCGYSNFLLSSECFVSFISTLVIDDNLVNYLTFLFRHCHFMSWFPLAFNFQVTFSYLIYLISILFGSKLVIYIYCKSLNCLKSQYSGFRHVSICDIIRCSLLWIGAYENFRCLLRKNLFWSLCVRDAFSSK